MAEICRNNDKLTCLYDKLSCLFDKLTCHHILNWQSKTWTKSTSFAASTLMKNKLLSQIKPRIVIRVL